MSNFFIVLYILTFIIGSVFITIITSLYMREKNDTYGALLGFCGAFLLYSVFEFMLCFLVNAGQGEGAVVYLIMASDVCYFTLILWWIRLISTLFGGYEPFKLKTLVILTVPYMITTEILGMRNSTYDQTLDTFAMNLGIEQTILMVMNIGYSLLIVGIGIMYLWRGRKIARESSFRKTFLILPISLICYIIWIMKWDYYLVGGMTTRGEDLTITDPLVSIYIFVCIIIIYKIYRKSDLDYLTKVQGVEEGFEEVPREDYAESFISSSGFTERESEVARLVCQGKGNHQIAEELFISEHTVKRHLNNIFKKTGYKGRFELIAAMNGKSRIEGESNLS